MALTLKAMDLTPKVMFLTMDEEKVVFLTTDDSKTLGLAQGSYFRCIGNPRGGGGQDGVSLVVGGAAPGRSEPEGPGSIPASRGLLIC